MSDNLTIPLSVSALNHALNSKVSRVTTDAFLSATINGDTLTIGLLVEVLLARIPKTDEDVRVKISGSASGGGKYNGNLWKNPTSVSASGNLSEADLGTSGNSCLILNVREVGKSTHDLASSAFLPLIFPGQLVCTNSDGTPVVVIDGFQWEDCT